MPDKRDTLEEAWDAMKDASEAERERRQRSARWAFGLMLLALIAAGAVLVFGGRG